MDHTIHENHNNVYLMKINSSIVLDTFSENRNMKILKKEKHLNFDA